jgi:hypothetical protein
MSNSIGLKSIECIIREGETKPFFVDSYQRGYKWDTEQVKDLLNDIYKFDPKKDGDFYCLQPVVVKEKDGIVELIDGQQRMTTIFIILCFLQKERFEIDYQTRKSSAWFLTNIIANRKIKSDNWSEFKNEDFLDGVNVKMNINNVDNFHFFTAFKTIKEWFTESINKEKFYNNLIQNTNVIWYQVNEDIKSQELFARINVGKIPLTNSELIKALFLSSEKNVDAIKNQIKVSWSAEKSQLEISGFEKIKVQNNDFKKQVALEWDYIEKELQNDEFWYFISDGKENRFTRIDLLLDIISDKNFEEKKNDSLNTFRYFSAENRDFFIEWNKITELFYMLQDWYNDYELYHLIGYQLAISGKNKIKTIYKEQQTKNKKEFKNFLYSEIQESDAIKKFGEYEYGSGLVQNVLLLFNIKTHIKTSSENNFNRFPFKSYKLNKWSIEHIHAQNSEGLNSEEQCKKWLEDAILGIKKFEKPYMTELLIKEIEEANNNDLTMVKFKELFDKIIELTPEKENYEIHDVSNLALLDGSTNSSISNGIFASKREMILNAEKNKAYIPICTKNVFLKYYTKDPKQFYFWSKEDREDYLKAIEEMIIYRPNEN